MGEIKGTKGGPTCTLCRHGSAVEKIVALWDVASLCCWQLLKG